MPYSSFIASQESSVMPSTVSPALVSLSASSDPPATLQPHEPPSSQSGSENKHPRPTGDTRGVSENAHIYGTVTTVAQGVSRLPKLN